MTIKENSWKNKLYFGDNLDILRDKIPDNYVDLIYLDPPFQSGKNYNQIFKPKANKIKGATAQISAFKDTWSWGTEAEENYEGLISGTITKESPNQKLIDLMKSMRNYLGEVSMMAYLSMMAPRLLEMKRVLKDSGSIYLHCDTTASHYLKLLMDSIFGVDNFKNEIIWCKSTTMYQSKTRFVPQHDVIFYYSKNHDKTSFYWEKVADPFSESTIKKYRHSDEKGRKFRLHGRNLKGSPIKNATDINIKWLKKAPHLVRVDYLDKKAGVKPKDWWVMGIINQASRERLGYPTQKPEILLEKIIQASTTTEDIVLDPFCGCGTTVAVAQRLKRKWIGIDITYLSIDIIAKRLEKSGYKKEKDYDIEGEPKDTYSASKLAKQNPFQFEIWCASKLNATSSQRQIGDAGVDGIVNFIDPTKKDKAGKGIIQVKGTQVVNPSMVRDLKGTIKSQGAEFGILVTLKKPTKGMIAEATKSGYFEWKYRKDLTQMKIPRIQFVTAEQLFEEPLPIKLPPIISPFKKPQISITEQEKLI